MEKLLIGKKAIITGATAGIGKEIALYFAQHGASVAIIGTNEQRAEQAALEIKKVMSPEQEVLVKICDVSDTEQAKKTLEEILSVWKEIDILINNAGIVRDNLLMKMSEEDWDKVLDVNLKSVFNTCKVLVRPMMKAKKGKVINITSVIGLIGNAGQINYASSKAGMIGFTKSLAKEVAKKNINVNAIAPGFIQTKMTDQLTEALKQDIIQKIPMQRLGTTLDIAKAAVFLASDMSDYITGQVITVDGGMVI